MSFVLVIQRYIPAYRVPLFNALAERLVDEDTQLLVAHRAPVGLQRARRDIAPPQPWAQQVRGASLRLPGGLEPTWERVGPLTCRANAIVAPLGSTSLNSWELLARYPEKTLLWGHGRSYVKKAGRLDSALEKIMCKKAAHVLTYTERGRASLLAQGFASSRVTAVGNSTDTNALLLLREQTRDDTGPWRRRLRSDGPVALFVGGLDSDKHIPMLLSAGRAAFGLDPSFRLVVAGSGRDSALVAEAAREPWLVAVAQASQRDLAALSHVCSAVWMPGRVGLVAVDALALGLPVCTTRFPFHAPEIDYLVEGESVHFLSREPRAFARAALGVMGRRSSDCGGGAWGWSMPTVEEVASKMAAAIMSVVRRS